MNNTLAVISFSDIQSDSRVLRQLSALSPYYHVVTVGYGPKPAHASFHFEVSRKHSKISKLVALFSLLLHQFNSFYSLWFDEINVLNFLVEYNVDLLILNDATAWPLAKSVVNCSSIFDAHEYTPGELSDSIFWNLFLRPFKLWCSSFIDYSSIRFCVESRLCQYWQDFVSLDFKCLPNTSEFVHPARVSANPSYPLRVLHHGIAHPSRRIELMLDAVSLAGPNFVGYFYLKTANPKYFRFLSRKATELSAYVFPPVDQSDLISLGHSFDIGLISIFPSNINYRFCLPNKLFQFIQSRLPIVCGPTPSIAEIVLRYKIGVVASDFSPASLSRALQSISPDDIIEMRRNLEIAARELCWDNDKIILVDAVDSVLNSRI